MTDDNLLSTLDYNRIENFLRGLMSAEEEAEFKKALFSDSELRQKTVAMAHLVKAMDAVGRERDQLVKDALLSTSKGQIAGMAAGSIPVECCNYEVTGLNYCSNTDSAASSENYPERKNRKVSRRCLVRQIISAAVVLLIAIGGYRYYRYRITTGLAKEYATAFASVQSAICRGTGTAQDRAMTREMKRLFYNVQAGKDMTETVDRLSFLWQVSTMDYYNAYIDYAPLIGWNLAIAHLKCNDADEAMKVLTVLSGGRYGDSVAWKSKELMEKLKY